MEEKNFIFEPATLVYDLLQNWWIILLGTVTAAIFSYVISGVTYVPEYSATTTYVVSAGPNADEWNNLRYGNDAAMTFESLIQSPAVKKIVSAQMGKKGLNARIETIVPDASNLVLLTVTDKTPQDTIDVMHKLMESYQEVSLNVIENAAIDVLEAPQIPLVPDNPLNEGAAAWKGGVLGLLLMIMGIGFMSCIKDTVKREEDIEEKLDAESMGVIPFERKEKELKDYFLKEKSSLLINNPLMSFRFVEAYKKLAVKIDYHMSKKNGKILLVTSVAENEGKSTVAANLAISLAGQSKKVLLIDGDLRRPAQYLIFGMNPAEKEEFGEFLKNGDMESVLQKSNIPNLYFVLGKNIYSSSTDILRSVYLSDFLEECRKYMDYVIIDSSPAGMLGDAEILADYSDEVLLVTKQHDILAEDINDVLDGFREHHSSVLGVVLNSVRDFNRLSAYGRLDSYGNYGKGRGI